MSSEQIYSDIEFPDDFDLRQEALESLAQRLKEVPIDTRHALSSFSPSADQYQSRVIESTQPTIRLVAPAGSGKTQTIINRVLTKISNGENPRRILILTFDNSAAGSLHLKLEEQRGQFPTPLEGLRISTLNAYGYGLLREYVPNEHKNVITDSRQRAIVREGQEELKRISPDRFAALPTNIRSRFYKEFYSLLKNQIFDPRELHPQEVADFMLSRADIGEVFFSHLNYDKALCKRVIEALLWLFKAYEKALQRDHVLDFDDQKLRAYISLKQNHNLLQVLQGQFSEVIVDEFQDINKLDFFLIKTLAEKSGLIVTGDDDQAIYGFRGCTPDYIIDLERHLGRPITSYELQINYRSPQNIVEHADRLIRNNIRRISKTPIAYNSNTSQIKVMKSLTAGIEARTIVSFIKRVRRSTPNLSFSDFAVLYRTNAQSLPLQIEFILNDIPYYVRKEDNILYNDTLAKLLGVLKLKLAISAEQQPQTSDQAHAIQAYFRFVSPQQVDQLNRFFQGGRNFLQTLSSPALFAIMPKIRESQIIPAMREILEAPSLIKTFDILAKRFHGLQGMIGSLEEVVEEKVPLGELYDVAANFKGNIKEFVETMERALEQARLSNAGEDRKAGVGLLTYFKSKGLQWHTVILTTCNEGIIPHKKAPVEDERRLFYVAMTRASSNLLISYLKNICKTSVSPSRFLAEAGLK